MLNWNFALLDFALIIPGAMGSLLTGFLICKTNSWGFTRYSWVIAKWIGTIGGILALLRYLQRRPTKNCCACGKAAAEGVM